MKQRSFALFFALLVFAFSTGTFAQGTAKTNEWHGLRLDASTIADVREQLGDPTTDKILQRFRPLRFEKWFDVQTKDFRVFHYKGSQAIQGFDNVRLFFRDGVLLAIRLEPKKLKAVALERAYDAEFTYLEDEISEILIPRDVGRRRGRPYPKAYPMFYYLMNESSEAFVFAAIDNNSVEEIFGDGRRSRSSRPGRVSKLDLISTRLESDDGGEVLK